MVKTLRFAVLLMALAILALMGRPAHAQEATQAYCRATGSWLTYPQVCPDQQTNWSGRAFDGYVGQNQGYYGGQRVVVAQQPLWGGYQQQQVIRQQNGLPPNCRLVEKSLWQRAGNGAVNLVVDAAIGGLLGAGSDRIFKTGGRLTRMGAAFGAANGLAEGWNERNEVICVDQQVQQLVPQGAVGGSCILQNGRAVNLSQEDCEAASGQSRRSQSRVEQQVVVQQSIVQAQNPCADDPGTRRGVLNLPGHPKNGTTVCARPGDTNISQWLE